MNLAIDTLALIYLVRGADAGWRESAHRFARSYHAHPAGLAHMPYILYKGFALAEDLAAARHILQAVAHRELHTGDDSLDIGAYLAAASEIAEPVVCFLNTHSEILAPDWLLKLRSNLEQPGIGLVGATGSFEGSPDRHGLFPIFPNVHIRTTGFMIRRAEFIELLRDVTIRDKAGAYQVESGTHSLTRRMLRAGQGVLVVGRDGRGYAPRWWPSSFIFRQAAQQNLLIGDNHTRAYAAAAYERKRELVRITWGPYVQGNAVLRSPSGR